MRIVGLFALIIFFPVFVHATALVNINTADITTLKTLPDIGDVIAQRIIDYRTGNGPFVRIEDIQNVKGIGPIVYKEIAPLITVGDTETPDVDTDKTASSTPPTSSDIASTTITVTPSSGGPPEYIPIPTLHIVTVGNHIVSTGADTTFSATVYDDKGRKRDDTLISWSFGDGMQRTGARVLHRYYDPGEYVVVIHASTPDGGEAIAENIVMAKDASIQIASVSDRGIALTNNSSRTLDLSFWRLSMGGKEFKIPVDTHLLAGRTILFASQIIQLPITPTASLLYPSGEVAATYPETKGAPSRVQPSSPVTSYQKVQKVEPIISKANAPINEEAVDAPTVVTELAAAGAALPAEGAQTGAVSIFRSPWTLGLLGIIVLAGAAFILL